MPICSGVSTRATALGMRCSTLKAHRDGRRLKEALAGLGLHVRSKLLAGAEFLDQLA